RRDPRARAGRCARCVSQRDPGSDGSRARARRRRMSSVEITVVADAEEAARFVAQRLAQQARAGGHVVLTGGSTPRRAYEIAAELEPDWSSVEISWGTSAACRRTTSARTTGWRKRRCWIGSSASPG